MNAKDLLTKRLRDLGETPVSANAHDCRTAILSMCCAEAVAGRLHPGGRVLTYRALYEEAFGSPFETRERAAKRRAG